MAIQVYHMQKDGLMCEHSSLAMLRSIRKRDTRFKYARIRQVLQMYPSQIKMGVPMSFSEWKTQEG